MNSFLISPAGAQNSLEVGGKAQQLSWLGQNGFDVPDWCVISQPTLALRTRNWTEPVQLVPEDLRQIEAWIQRHQVLGVKSFIVRSSALDEDGGEASFAGMFESYPGLGRIDEIVQAIAACVDSASSSRVRSYRYQSGQGGGGKQGLAVILQVMIDADKAGVLFTADPSDGSRRRFVVSALYGAGHGVVSGECACDEYFMAVPTSECRSQIANKEECFRSGASGLVRTPVAKELRERPVLSSRELALLKTLGLRSTALAGRPVDIEWVIAADRLFVVQLRPITGLGLDTSVQNETVFDNSNIQESFSGLTAPLTFSYAVEVYRFAYNQLMEITGFAAHEIDANNNRHGRMLALVRGRVYYNIKSWYDGLLLMPSFGRNKEDMEKMMGVERPIDFVVDQKLSQKEKLRRLPRMLKLLAMLMWRFHRIDQEVLHFRTQFTRLWKEFRKSELRWMSAPELFDYFLNLKQRILRTWKAPLINDFYVMMKSGQVRRTLEKVGFAHQISDLLCGEDLESLNPTLRLIEIAEQLRKYPALCQRLSEPAAFLKEAAQIPAVWKLWTSYLENYGDRVVGELKLESRSYYEDASFPIGVLRSYVSDRDLSPQTFKERQMCLRETAEREVFARIQKDLGRLRLFLFRRELRAFRKAVRYREAMRLDRCRAFGMVRVIFGEIGTKLAEQGFIDSQEDVFYLTISEVEDFLYAKAPFDSPKELITERRNQYAKWAKETVSGQLRASLPFREIKSHVEIKLDGELAGLGCYPGQVEGEVVVMCEPNIDVDLKGKILVALRTDPGWTPLFAQIKGLIVERGSMLSHSAVIAREMGIPTVVGVPGITELFKSGDRIRMDGQMGTITRLNLNQEPQKIMEVL